MTHLSPTTLLFCSVCTAVGFVYFLWHSWSFDRFQSLIPTKRRAFKCGITWSVLVAYGMFGVWSVGMAYIKYNVGFTTVPQYGSIPTPFELWPESYQKVTDPLYYVLIVAWGMILSIHIEETCFWIHLARSIRGLTHDTWQSSAWFKLWLLGSVVGIVTLFMTAIPFADEPQRIETHVFFVGTVFTLIFTAASFYVIIRFPVLIETVRAQGGSQIVLNRLSYFRRLTKYRVVARVIFIVPFLTISADGLTPHHDMAKKQFLTDMFIMLGVFGLFATTIFSIFMFFPPSDNAIVTFTESNNLLTERERNMSIDAMRSYFEPSSRAMPPVSASGPANSRNHQRSQSKEHIRSEFSVVAPFATPPPSPPPAASDSTHVERTRSKRVRQASNGASTQDLSLPTSEVGSAPASSAYAWNLLADHLRIPAGAMGMMGEMTEINSTAWRAARRDAEREMYPGTQLGRQGRGHDRRRSASPEKLVAPRLSLSVCCAASAAATTAKPPKSPASPSRPRDRLRPVYQSQVASGV